VGPAYLLLPNSHQIPRPACFSGRNAAITESVMTDEYHFAKKQILPERIAKCWLQVSLGLRLATLRGHGFRLENHDHAVPPHHN